MHKKLEAELVSLANSILEMENNEEIAILHKKAQEVYEKLTVLKFVESNLNAIVSEKVEIEEVVEEKSVIIEDKIEASIIEEEPEVIESIAVIEDKVEEIVKEEVFEEIELETNTSPNIFEEKQVEDVFNKPIETEEPKVVAKLTEEEVESIFTLQDEFVKNDMEEIPSIQHTLEEEFENAISADVATNLFEKATKEEPVIEETIKEVEDKIEEKKVSLNDALFKDNIQVGLNDRIAFVKYLFEGSQEDFNRVLSQLNSFDTEKEAKSFLNRFVKPDYNWNNKEEFENRLINLIERKFL